MFVVPFSLVPGRPGLRTGRLPGARCMRIVQSLFSVETHSTCLSPFVAKTPKLHTPPYNLSFHLMLNVFNALSIVGGNIPTQSQCIFPILGSRTHLFKFFNFAQLAGSEH